MTRSGRAHDAAERRPDLHERLEHQIDRYARRESDSSSFWRSLSVLGSVGWPIVLASVGGALAGRWMDAVWHTGIRFTLIFLVAGVGVGTSIAWHLVKPRSK